MSPQSTSGQVRQHASERLLCVLHRARRACQQNHPLTLTLVAAAADGFVPITAAALAAATARSDAGVKDVTLDGTIAGAMLGVAPETLLMDGANPANAAVAAVQDSLQSASRHINGIPCIVLQVYRACGGVLPSAVALWEAAATKVVSGTTAGAAAPRHLFDPLIVSQCIERRQPALAPGSLLTVACCLPVANCCRRASCTRWRRTSTRCSCNRTAASCTRTCNTSRSPGRHCPSTSSSGCG